MNFILLRCPCCGSSAEFRDAGDNRGNGDFVHVECINCKLRTTPQFISYGEGSPHKRHAEIAAIWNRRAP